MNPFEGKIPFESQIIKEWREEFNSFNASCSTLMGDPCVIVTLLRKAAEPESHVCIPSKIGGKRVTVVRFPKGYIRKGLESIFIPETVTSITGLDFEATKDLKSIVVADDNPAYWSDGKALYSKDKTKLLKCFAYDLKEFAVPNGVQTIEKNAFLGQWNLRKVIFPESLRRIAWQAFCRCINLSTVIGLESVERIDYKAFDETPYWSGKRIWIHDDILEWYAAPGQKVIQVPEGVREIASYAFECKDPVVEKIELPSTLKQIDQNAFNVISIYAWGLQNLTEIRIPEGVETIPERLFRDLPNLETVFLPSTVNSIAADAFPPADYPGSSGLHFKRIEVDPRNEYFASIDGILYTKDLTRLIKVPCLCPLSTLILPDGLTAIYSGAFRRNHTIKRVVLPETCIVISANAFDSCSLESINLENTVNIGERAFALCKIKRIDLKKAEIIRDNAFIGCDITSIELPETLQILGQGAFSGCPLEQATIPKSVQSIGNGIFTNLKHLIIYDSIQADISQLNNSNESYDVSVLSAETGLLKFRVSLPSTDNSDSAKILAEAWKPGAVFDYTAIDRCFLKQRSVDSKLQVCIIRLKDPIDLSDDAKERYISYLKKNSQKILTALIDRNDFDGFAFCLKIVTIKKTNIDALLDYATQKKSTEISAFLIDYSEKCYDHSKDDLQSLSIDSGVRVKLPWSLSRNHPSCVSRYTGGDTEIVFPTELQGRRITGIAERKTTISDNYKALVSVEIPEGYESIGNFAFEYCENLEYVVLPSTLKRIGARAFAECGKLKKIILPDTVSYIGAGCFAHCSSLTTVILPKALSTLEEGTFWYCLSLKTIDIPKNIEYIEDRCFYASGLQSATIHHLSPKIYASTFDEKVIISAYWDWKSIWLSINKVSLADMPSETTVLISGTEKSGSQFSFRLFMERSEQTITKLKKRILRAEFRSFSDGNALADWLTGVYTEPLLSALDMQAELLRIRNIGPLSSIKLREEKANEDGHTSAEYAFDYGTCVDQWRREGTFIAADGSLQPECYETNTDDSDELPPEESEPVPPSPSSLPPSSPPSPPTVASSNSLFSFTPVSSIDFDGKIFVLTGFDENDESRLTHIIIENGGELKSSVVLKTDYLIVNENYDHQTVKYKKAVELNGKGKDIKILSFAMFDQLLP